MKRTYTFILVMLAIGLQAVSQETYTLTYKMGKGNVYRYQSENSYDATQEMMGNEMKVTGDIRTILRFEIEDVLENGTMALITSTEESISHTTMMGKDTTIRQTKDIGKRTRVEIDPSGKKLNETAIDSVGKKTSFMVGDNNLITLPADPLKIGEKWTRTSVDTTRSEDNETITTVSSDFELAGKEIKNGHECLKVNYKKTYEITGKIRQMGMDMFMEGNGESTGSYWFDVEKGLFIADESALTQDITVAITGQTQMTIPSSQVIQMKTYLIE
jgi:hypothetical protein